jgi:hypothetical protein
MRAMAGVKDEFGVVYIYAHFDAGWQMHIAVARAIEEYPMNWRNAPHMRTAILTELQLRAIGDDSKAKELRMNLGFGIYAQARGDVEHVIPVLDCDLIEIVWEVPERLRQQLDLDMTARAYPAIPEAMSFSRFVKACRSGAFDNL